MSRYEETALAISCGPDRLIGVLSAPCEGEAHRRSQGVLIVVGGPQYRVGSHRQFVLLARRLAAQGYAVLRFDMRGMGDSAGQAADFDARNDDIAAGIAALLQAQPHLDRVVLWGLCDGASAALLYVGATHDARVSGLCLVNPWVRSQVSLARTHVKHYYLERLLQPAFWSKLLRGGVGVTALRDLGHNLRLARTKGTPERSFQQHMAAAWMGFGGSVLVLLSEKDLTAQEFMEHAASDPAWQGALQQLKMRSQTIAGADHTLSGAQARRDAEKSMIEWMKLLPP